MSHLSNLFPAIDEYKTFAGGTIDRLLKENHDLRILLEEALIENKRMQETFTTRLHLEAVNG